MTLRRTGPLRVYPLPALALTSSLAILMFLGGCRDRSERAPLDDALATDALASEVKDIEGSISIDGSSTVAPISTAAAEAFEKEFRNVRVTVAISGTGGGFGRFALGETDISDASRPIKPDELAVCRENGVRFVELPIAYDGLSIVVNKENNFVDSLTIDQLKMIFLEEGGAKTWQDVNPDWPDTEIKIYAPGTDSGTFDYFFGDVVAKNEEMEHPRDDMSVSEDDNNLVNGVAGEKGAIGFFGASYYFTNQDKIKAVKIVNPETGEAVAPTSETIEDGSYAPFGRPLFLYINVASLKRPEVKQFLKFYLANAGNLAEQVNYVALTDEIYERGTEHVENRLAGVHFLNETMEKQTGTLSELYRTDNLVGAE
ncbi:PstS family phosphate ABC transporter substrate-binding protein [Allorhodopirellula solitaria]|uniref:Phosphate-binding protein n=1 Tax=Allorhodopirellula solitaria TaxID=2527987 RepID=A0A5C5YDX4_9BACT|nr:PstS family phosphate ABC transporter substrate-binding protein [Allorhodopirellula solitaria]TWT73178.1 Phosphate-binding protein PstS precursor [Allorhodopirellula solitaria]